MTKPIGWGDIALALGMTSQDLGYLIKNGGIYEYLNKWSFRKPVRYNKWGQLTDEEIASVHCGLSPVVLSKLLLMIAGNDSTAYSYTETECRAEIDEWPYHYPRGLSYNEPFNSFDLENYHGYAVAPDADWAGLSLDDTDLDILANVTVSATTTSPYTGKNYKLTPYYNGSACNGYRYSAFSILFGPDSSWRWGNATQMDIPLNYIVSLEGNWRLCMAVWLPNYNNNVGGWGIFCSRMTVLQFFSEGLSDKGLLFPDFATNTYAATLMESYVTSQGGYFAFNAVPLLVNNLAFHQTSGSPSYYIPYADSETVAYCMPSGVGSNMAVSIACGEPPFVPYYDVSISKVGSNIVVTIKNIHETNTYRFDYVFHVRNSGGTIIGTISDTVTLAAQQSSIVIDAQFAPGAQLSLDSITQTQV